jgi:hypothetical protein
VQIAPPQRQFLLRQKINGNAPFGKNAASVRHVLRHQLSTRIATATASAKIGEFF